MAIIQVMNRIILFDVNHSLRRLPEIIFFEISYHFDVEEWDKRQTKSLIKKSLCFTYNVIWIWILRTRFAKHFWKLLSIANWSDVWTEVKCELCSKPEYNWYEFKYEFSVSLNPLFICYTIVN